MPRWTVIRMYEASTSDVVAAATPDEAVEVLTDWPSLCHQCSGELELGDTAPVRVIVLDEHGREVPKPPPPRPEFTDEHVREALARAGTRNGCRTRLARRTGEKPWRLPEIARLAEVTGLPFDALCFELLRRYTSHKKRKGSAALKGKRKISAKKG